MNEALLPALKRLYVWDKLPEYFAGGHAWSDGTLFKFEAGGSTKLLKVMPAGGERSLESVSERQAFTEYLFRNGIDTVLPLHSVAGNLAEAFIHEGKSYIAYSWEMVPGSHTELGDPRNCTAFYTRWGSLLGKMHRLAKAWPDWQFSASRDTKGPLISRAKEWEHFYRWIPDPEVKEAWLKLRSELDALPQTRENFGFIHNDAHPGNILSAGERLILIDFDVSNYLWFMVDIAICIYSEYSRVKFHSPWGKRSPELDQIFVQPFMQAYESENKLPAGEYARIELFLNYRRFLMFACFYDQIKDNNPAYLEIFKQEIIQGRRFLGEDNYFTRFKI